MKEREIKKGAKKEKDRKRKRERENERFIEGTFGMVTFDFLVCILVQCIKGFGSVSFYPIDPDPLTNSLN